MILAILLTILQIFDGWTTYKIIKRGGKELNPIVRSLIERLGLYQGLLVAKGFAVALGWVLVLFSAPAWTVVLVLIACLAVAWRNWRVYDNRN